MEHAVHDWSPLNMIETGVWHLVNHTAALTHFRGDLQERRRCDNPGYGHASGAFTANDRNNIYSVVDLMSPWLEALSLNASIDCVNRIRAAFDEKGDSHLRDSHLREKPRLWGQGGGADSRGLGKQRIGHRTD